MDAATPLPGGEESLFVRCLAGSTIREACSGLVDDLHERWVLPSVYLLIDGRLRCHGSRGYFQVCDGFTTSTGVIGRVVGRGVKEVIEDVSSDPSFIAAIPGVFSEACIPVTVHGEVVGAVNLESTTRLDAQAVLDLETAARVLGNRIEELGGLREVSLAERLGRIAVELASQTQAADVQQIAVDAAIEMSGMSSAALARRDGGTWSVLHASGPLTEAFESWGSDVLGTLGGWVWAGTSSYFPDGEHVPEGYEFLGQGIRALAVQPLIVAGVLTGLLLTADTRPSAHDPAQTSAMELLASQTAATLAMVETLDALGEQATRDPLTGLANRRHLNECLQAALDRGSDWDPHSALVLLDLDGFKAVNDHHGHAAGDELLCEVGRRLQACARDEDVVCRLGGDEFAVLVHGVANEEQAASVGRRLVAAITERRAAGWHPTVGASAGVRLLSGGSASTMLVDADRALYAAKHAGRGGTIVWEPALRQHEIDHQLLVEDLRNALASEQLTLVYQPIVDIRTLEVRGLEALARWHHPDRGPIPPSVFVEAAEQAGLVPELTRWVLRTVCLQLASWVNDVGVDLNVGINLSATQLTDDAVVRDVRQALTDARLAAKHIVLEVTETSAVADLPRAKRTLEALADLGVGLALDDFGTGYSSLTHAQALPFDILKIDRSFVAAAAEGDRRALATIAAVCALAGRLQVDVVAEGVENLRELAELTALGCSYAQGFALARPVPTAAVTAALAAPGPWLLGSPPASSRALSAVPPPRNVKSGAALLRAE